LTTAVLLKERMEIEHLEGALIATVKKCHMLDASCNMQNKATLRP